MFGRATTAARKRFKFPPPPQTSADQRGSLPRRAPTNSLIAPRQLQMSNEKKLIPIPSTSLEAQRYFGLQNRQKRELLSVPGSAVASLVSAACAIAASVSAGYATFVRSFANKIRPQDMRGVLDDSGKWNFRNLVALLAFASFVLLLWNAEHLLKIYRQKVRRVNLMIYW